MQKVNPILFINLELLKKECDETVYWLELVKETNFITLKEYESIYPEAIALLKMIRSSILTTKKNITHNS